jgi:hypothetical protein
MGSGRRIVLVAGAILASVFLAWMFSTKREPVYQGKSLTTWLHQYHTNRWPLDKEAEAAIRHFGTNASPVLLQLMSTRESAVTLKLLAIVPKKLQAQFQGPTVNDYVHKVSGCRRVGAAGFMTLGEQARPTVPNLIALLDDKNKDVRYLAVFALRCLGPVARDALPALTNCLSDPEFAVRDDAVMALGTMRAEPERVVPLIIAFLEKYRSDHILSRDAIYSLMQFKADAKPAIPILLSFLDNQNAEVQSAAAMAIREIAPETAAKAGAK